MKLINGIRTIKQISVESKIDTPILLSIINSLKPEFIVTVPQYFQNSHFTTDLNFNKLFQNHQILKSKICEYSFYSIKTQNNSEKISKNPLDFYDVIVRILTFLINGCSVIELPNLFNKQDIEFINIKCLIDFAMVNNLIKLIPSFKIKVNLYDEEHQNISYENQNVNKCISKVRTTFNLSF